MLDGVSFRRLIISLHFPAGSFGAGHEYCLVRRDSA
jgi:hypothetical protein